VVQVLARGRVVAEDVVVGVGGRFLAARRLWPAAGVTQPETLVLLHEGLGCIDMWRRFPEILAWRSGCAVVVYDRWGYGRSDRRDRPWGLQYLHEAALEELPGLLDVLGVDRPVLLGHSDGGTIALIHAAHHPVRAAVTMAAHAWVEQAAVDGVAQTVQAWHEGRLESRLARYHGAATRDVFFRWADTWQAEWFRGWSIGELLGSVVCPVEVIQGCSDEYATREHALQLANGLGGCHEVHLLPDVGHAAYRDAGPAVVEIMVRALTRSWLSAA